MRSPASTWPRARHRSPRSAWTWPVAHRRASVSGRKHAPGVQEIAGKKKGKNSTGARQTPSLARSILGQDDAAAAAAQDRHLPSASATAASPAAASAAPEANVAIGRSIMVII